MTIKGGKLGESLCGLRRGSPLAWNIYLYIFTKSGKAHISRSSDFDPHNSTTQRRTVSSLHLGREPMFDHLTLEKQNYYWLIFACFMHRILPWCVHRQAMIRAIRQPRPENTIIMLIPRSFGGDIGSLMKIARALAFRRAFRVSRNAPSLPFTRGRLQVVKSHEEEFLSLPFPRPSIKTWCAS